MKIPFFTRFDEIKKLFEKFMEEEKGGKDAEKTHGGSVQKETMEKALCDAAWKGDVVKVRQLLQAGVDVGSRDAENDTPLHRAAYHGRSEVVNILLTHGAVVNCDGQRCMKPLHYAAGKGHNHTVQKLLDSSADVNCKGEDSWTPLHFTSQNGHCDVVKTLVSHGADVNSTEGHKWTPLHLASHNGHCDVVSTLMSHGADVKCRTQNDYSPLHLASQNGHCNVVNTLVSHGADVNSREKNNLTPLHLASQNGHCDVVNALVSHGADVNSRKEDKWTPLHLASQNGHCDVVKKLVSHGADVNSRGEDNWTPLHLASQNGHCDVVKILLPLGADVECRTHKHYSPLHIASQNGHCDVVNSLLSYGADVNSRGEDNRTPLHFASQNGYCDVVNKLVSHGADVNSRGKDNWTPLHIASQNGHCDVVKTLVSHGADINAVRHSNYTPLHESAKHGHPLIVELLLDLGANLHCLDNDHCTPLHLAARKGHPFVAEILLSNGASVNVQNNMGNTPLHNTAEKAKVSVAKILLNHSSQVNALNHHNSTPLHLAVLNNHIDMVALLLHYGADVKATDASGGTPLHDAFGLGEEEIAALLLCATIIEVSVDDILPTGVASVTWKCDPVSQVLHENLQSELKFDAAFCDFPELSLSYSSLQRNQHVLLVGALPSILEDQEKIALELLNYNIFPDQVTVATLDPSQPKPSPDLLFNSVVFYDERLEEQSEQMAQLCNYLYPPFLHTFDEDAYWLSGASALFLADSLQGDNWKNICIDLKMTKWEKRANHLFWDKSARCVTLYWWANASVGDAPKKQSALHSSLKSIAPDIIKLREKMIKRSETTSSDIDIQGGVVDAGDVKVHIPTGALTRKTTLHLRLESPAEEMFQLQEHNLLEDVQLEKFAIILQPHGQKFRKRVRVEVKTSLHPIDEKEFILLRKSGKQSLYEDKTEECSLRYSNGMVQYECYKFSWYLLVRIMSNLKELVPNILNMKYSFVHLYASFMYNTKEKKSKLQMIMSCDHEKCTIPEEESQNPELYRTAMGKSERKLIHDMKYAVILERKEIDYFHFNFEACKSERVKKLFRPQDVIPNLKELILSIREDHEDRKEVCVLELQQPEGDESRTSSFVHAQNIAEEPRAGPEKDIAEQDIRLSICKHHKTVFINLKQTLCNLLSMEGQLFSSCRPHELINDNQYDRLKAKFSSSGGFDAVGDLIDILEKLPKGTDTIKLLCQIIKTDIKQPHFVKHITDEMKKVIPLQILKELSNYSKIPENQTQKLECEVSKPDITARWVHDDEDIQPGEGKWTRFTAQVEWTVHQLTIQDVKPTDAGVYTCMFSDNVDNVKTQGKLHVTELDTSDEEYHSANLSNEDIETNILTE